MKRTNTMTIGEAIEAYFNSCKLGTQLDEHKAVELWPQVVDPLVASRTAEVKVYKGRMQVKFTSSIARDAMMMKKQETIKKINEALGSDVIKDIFMQ